MGATLRYAKVVDREYLQVRGGLAPSVDNVIILTGPPPAPAREFVVLRAWDDVTSGFSEQWRLEDGHGRTIYTGAPRTVLAEHGDVSDVVVGATFDHADSAHQLVLGVDDREVARTDITVTLPDDPRFATPPASPVGAASVTDAPAADTEAGTAPSGQGDDAPVSRELSESEQRTLDAVARLETSGAPGFDHTIAREAAMDLTATREALSGLTGRHDLVQEVSTGADDDPDLGPRYRIKARP